jgi:phytanoyl-CoA hydroxylase
MGSLTQDQIDHYWQEGYVIASSVLETDEIERYLSRAREIANGDIPDAAANRLVKDIVFAKGKRPMPKDPEHALWKILNPDRFDAVMAECLRLPRVLDAVESLIGEDLMAFLLMFIYKPPGVEQAVHPFHQDAAYFMFQPQEKCLGVWIPLDPVSEENGALTIVPRSHELDVRNHQIKQGINFGALAAEGIEDNPEYHDKAITLSMEPGDCLLFNTRLLHRSGGNRTAGHRRVITLHMASSTCEMTGPALSEYGFAHVRGRTYPGCLEPARNLELKLVHRLVER